MSVAELGLIVSSTSRHHSFVATATSGLLHALAALALVWQLPPRAIELGGRVIDVTVDLAAPQPAAPPPAPQPVIAQAEPPPAVDPAELAGPPLNPPPGEDTPPPQPSPQPPPHPDLAQSLPPLEEPPVVSPRELAQSVPPPAPVAASPPPPAEPPAPPVRRATASEQTLRKAEEDYLVQVIQKLSRYRYIPSTQQVNERGMVLTRLTVARDGRLLDVALTKSSGFPTLDQGLLATIRQAAPFAPLPADIAGNQLSLIVPISYTRAR